MERILNILSYHIAEEIQEAVNLYQGRVERLVGQGKILLVFSWMKHCTLKKSDLYIHTVVDGVIETH